MPQCVNFRFDDAVNRDLLGNPMKYVNVRISGICQIKYENMYRLQFEFNNFEVLRLL